MLLRISCETVQPSGALVRVNGSQICVDSARNTCHLLAGIKDATVDVVISNCVINLCADKNAVFREIWRVLRPGGELYFSDVFTDRRVPDSAKADKVIWGECLAGAMYRKDFAQSMAQAGFAAHWVVSHHVH